MKVLERYFAVLIFPLTLGVAVAICLHLMASGYKPELALGPLIFSVGLLVMVLERLFPHQRSWLKSRGDILTDIAYAIFSGQLVSMLVAPLAAATGVYLLSFVVDQVENYEQTGFWPGHWHLLAQLPIALIIAEFPKYWHHRLQHTTDFLWRFHATHHSAPRLYWLNAARFHPIDMFIDNMLGGLVLALLGCSIELIALFSLVSGVHGFFQHANLKLKLGPLNYFFSMAELHRWHHSKKLEEANHNYGQNVIIWDLVFGTFYLPKDREPPENIGIPNLSAFPMTFWQQLASPFTWRRIKQASRE